MFSMKYTRWSTKEKNLTSVKTSTNVVPVNSLKSVTTVFINSKIMQMNKCFNKIIYFYWVLASFFCFIKFKIEMWICDCSEIIFNLKKTLNSFSVVPGKYYALNDTMHLVQFFWLNCWNNSKKKKLVIHTPEIDLTMYSIGMVIKYTIDENCGMINVSTIAASTTMMKPAFTRHVTSMYFLPTFSWIKLVLFA